MSMWKTKVGSGDGNFEKVPTDTYPCVCVGLVDLGTHPESFRGGPIKELRKIALIFELHGVDEKSQPKQHYMAVKYTFSLGEKSGLRKFLIPWRGKPLAPGEEIDFEKLLGATGQASVVPSDDGKYTNLNTVVQLPKNSPKPVAKVPLFHFEIDSGADFPNYKWIPFLYGRPIPDIIAESKERRGGKPLPVGAGVSNGSTSDGPTEDEIPF